MIPRLNQVWMLFGIAALVSQVSGVLEKQIRIAPPVPGLPETSSIKAAANTTKTRQAEVLLSNSYLPAAMQAIAYYVELIQYEPVYTTTIEPPYQLSTETSIQAEESTNIHSTTQQPWHTTTIRSSSRPTLHSTTRYTTKPTWYSTAFPVTTRPTTPTRPTIPTHPTTPTIPTRPTTPTVYTTTSRPPISTIRSTPIPWYLDQTTPVHNPGNYQPSNPIYDYTQHRPTQKPQIGNLPLLSISQTQFFDWFLQMKTKQLSEMSEYDLQFLHQLPSGLLQDILYERYEQPALLDKDNVNEFLKVYDDFYGRNQPVTGRKKIPPTKPYVQLLMLYDLLKREAKKLMLNKFQGYSAEMLEELNAISQGSAERQLHTILYRMIERKDVDKTDVIVRVNSIVEDLLNPESTLAMSLRYIPPLAFLP